MGLLWNMAGTLVQQASHTKQMRPFAFCSLAGMLVQQASHKKQKRPRVAYEDDDLFKPTSITESQFKDTVNVDPTVNVAADYYDSFKEGYGNLHDARKVRMASAYLFRTLNLEDLVLM